MNGVARSLKWHKEKDQEGPQVAQLGWEGHGRAQIGLQGAQNDTIGLGGAKRAGRGTEEVRRGPKMVRLGQEATDKLRGAQKSWEGGPRWRNWIRRAQIGL